MKQLVKLEEKVPSIKTETEDVFEALGEQKDAVYTRISSGKDAITGRLAGGKDAITSRLSSGKDAISTSLQSGKEAVYSRIQAGSEVIANTRAGCLVGSGVDRTLQATENIVDYLLPEDEQKKEESGSSEVKEGKVDASSQEAKDDSSSSEESEGEEEEEGASRVGRVKNLSRKVKLRIYYRTLRRLDTVQQQCKSALEQLKLHIDLVSWCSIVSVSSVVWLWLCASVTVLALCEALCVCVELATSGPCSVTLNTCWLVALAMKQG